MKDQQHLARASQYAHQFERDIGKVTAEYINVLPPGEKAAALHGLGSALMGCAAQVVAIATMGNSGRVGKSHKLLYRHLWREANDFMQRYREDGGNE